MSYYQLLTVFIYNLLFLSGIPILLKYLLFCRTRSLLGYKLFFTPGIIIRKEKQLLQKIDQGIIEYHKFCLDKDSATLTRVEDKLSKIIFQKTEFLQNCQYLPSFLSLLLRKALSGIIYQIALQAGREILPSLSCKYEIETRLQDLRSKIEPELIEELSQKYFFKYLLYFFATLGILTGTTNVIIICLF